MLLCPYPLLLPLRDCRLTLVQAISAYERRAVVRVICCEAETDEQAGVMAYAIRLPRRDGGAYPLRRGRPQELIRLSRTIRYKPFRTSTVWMVSMARLCEQKARLLKLPPTKNEARSE